MTLIKLSDEQSHYPIYNLQDAPRLYQEFLNKYKKDVDDTNYKAKYKNFVNTLQEINRVNRQLGSVKVDLNKNADLSEMEKIEIQEEGPSKRIDEELEIIEGRHGAARMTDFFDFKPK